MRADKMTNKFQIALSEAQSLAVGRDHPFIEPIHLMVALLVAEAFRRLCEIDVPNPAVIGDVLTPIALVLAARCARVL